MQQRLTEDNWKTGRRFWNNFGTTANMSRCPRLESRLIWAVIPKLFQEYLAIFQLSSVGLCSIIEASFSCDIKT